MEEEKIKSLDRKLARFVFDKTKEKEKKKERIIKSLRDSSPRIVAYRCSICDYINTADTNISLNGLSDITKHCGKKNHIGAKIQYLNKFHIVISEHKPNINNIKSERPPVEMCCIS